MPGERRVVPALQADSRTSSAPSSPTTRKHPGMRRPKKPSNTSPLPESDAENGKPWKSGGSRKELAVGGVSSLAPHRPGDRHGQLVRANSIGTSGTSSSERPPRLPLPTAAPQLVRSPSAIGSTEGRGPAGRRFSTMFLEASVTDGPKRLPAMPRKSAAKYSSTKGTFYTLKKQEPTDNLLGCSVNPFKRVGIWYDNLNVRKKQIIALILCELLTISTLVSVHVAVLYTSSVKELETRAASEILTNEIVYNIKIGEMALGLQTSAENADVVQAGVLGLSTQQAAVDARKAARRLLQQECFRRDIEYATLVKNDETLAIIVNANKDRSGEKGFNLGGLVAKSIKANKQMSATLLVPRSELVAAEGLFAADTTTLWLVRFVATPVYANPSDKSKGPVAILVSGDVVNNKPYTVAPSMEVFKTGYVAVYQRASQQGDTSASRYALSASLWSPEPGKAAISGVELSNQEGYTLLDRATDAGAASSAVARFAVNGTYMTVIGRVIPDANGQPAAFLVRGLPHTEADNLLKFTLLVSLLSTIPIFIISALLALWMGRAISGPLSTLQSTVENFFKGDRSSSRSSKQPAQEDAEEDGEEDEEGGEAGPFAGRGAASSLERMKKNLEVRITSKDEVGKLAASFNRMSVRVSEAYARVEEARKKAAVEEYRTRQIMDAAPDAIVLVDSRCRVISMNRSATDLFGYEQDELLGRNVNVLMPPEIAAKHDGYVQRYLNTGSERVIGTLTDIVGIHRDGSEIPVEISLSEMHIAGSTFFIGMIRDVTIRKEMEAELEHERQKTEALLRNMLPVGIAERLKEMQDAEQSWKPSSIVNATGRGNGGAVRGALADRVENVSIMFTDIVNFTPLAGSMDAAQLVTLLNQIFSEFDSLAEKYGLEKIKTLGDAFMCAGGVPPDRNSSRREPYVERMAKMALEMHEIIARFKTFDGKPFRIRIGMHVGTVIAGVIGKNKYLYDLWGDAVNVASRMESSGVPGRTQVTADLYEMLKYKFEFEDRGRVQVKGKGELHTYFLVGVKPNADSSAMSPFMRRQSGHNIRGNSAVMQSFVTPERLFSPDLAVWQLPTGSYPALMHQMLDALGVVSRLQVRAQELHGFITAALASYREKNPFHNQVHAMDVSHAMFYMISRLRPAPRQALALEGPPGADMAPGALPGGRAALPVFDDIDTFALMIAALAHDLEHPALTNLFLIKSKAPMALLYSNSSPLERHHSSRFLVLLERTDLDICSGLNPEERQRFTQFVIDVILATDMMLHGEYMAAFKARFLTPVQPGALVPARPLYGAASPPGARLAHLDDKTLFAAMLLKCADLANGARTFENSQHWAAAIQQEFFEQGHLEQELGLEVSPGMAPTDDPDMGSSGRQIFFLGNIVQPLYEAVAEIAPNAMDILLSNIKENVERWRWANQHQERRASADANTARDDDD